MSTANDNVDLTQQVSTAEVAATKLRLIKGYITQYEDGLITLHEMAGAIISKAYDLGEQCFDQGCDGLPPNDILPPIAAGKDPLPEGFF